MTMSAPGITRFTSSFLVRSACTNVIFGCENGVDVKYVPTNSYSSFCASRSATFLPMNPVAPQTNILFFAMTLFVLRKHVSLLLNQIAVVFVPLHYLLHALLQG